MFFARPKFSGWKRPGQVFRLTRPGSETGPETDQLKTPGETPGQKPPLVQRHAKAERILRQMIVERVRLLRLELVNVEIQLAKAAGFTDPLFRDVANHGAQRYALQAYRWRERRNALCAALRALRTP